MNQAVPVSIELSPKRPSAKYTVYALLFGAALLILQLLCPAWKIVWTNSETPTPTVFERPMVETPLARGFLFLPPNPSGIAPPPGSKTSSNPNFRSTAAQIDGKATTQVLLISLVYLGVGAFGVFAGKPDLALLKKRMRQFVFLSGAILLVGAGMAIYSCAAGKMSPQAYWHQVF
ncbi:MAG: hypothetical protein K2W95_11000 [Candidatus Obscuribacterales bacterium]|nr:hypothetical protein [Candidatus Obscuribacterales bacterium]